MLDACMIHMMPYLHNLFGTIVKAKEGKGKRERDREIEREREREREREKERWQKR
jgi:hypothetical protein